MGKNKHPRRTKDVGQGPKNTPASGTITVERRWGDPEANESVAVVEYHKTSTTSVRVMAADITTRSTTHKAYDLYWFVPGQGVEIDPEAGVACDLRHTSYVLENLTDYTLYIRMQRPMGYKDAPTVIGMWEPLGIHSSKEEEAMFHLKPRSKKHFSVANASTSFMTLRRDMKYGRVVVQLASFTMFRDVLNDHGNKVAPEGVAFTLFAETHFRVNDGKVGKDKGYCIDTLPNAKHMDFISAGPPVSAFVSNLMTDKGAVDYLIVDRSGSASLSGTLILKAVTGQSCLEEFTGLDKETWYRLPAVTSGAVSGLGTVRCDIAYYNSTAKRWVVGFLRCISNGGDTVSPAEVVPAKQIDDNKGMATVILGSDRLMPAKLRTTRPDNLLKTVRKQTIRATRARTVVHSAGFVLLENESVTTVLDAIVMIVEVVRVVASFAAALGFLKEDDNVAAGGGDHTTLSSM